MDAGQTPCLKTLLDQEEPGPPLLRDWGLSGAFSVPLRLWLRGTGADWVRDADPCWGLIPEKQEAGAS